MLITAVNLIRGYVISLPPGTPFTTRDLLGCGLRAAVDQVTCRLVKSGRIRRLARGVFVRDTQRSFTFEEIAKIKVESFQRRIAKHTMTIFKEIRREQDSKQESRYCINACPSKFQLGETTIILKEESQRKAALSQTVVGQRLKALWAVGEDNLTADVIRQAMEGVSGGPARWWVQENIFLLPAWLSDRFLRLGYLKFGKFKRKGPPV